MFFLCKDDSRRHWSLFFGHDLKRQQQQQKINYFQGFQKPGNPLNFSILLCYNNKLKSTLLGFCVIHKHNTLDRGRLFILCICIQPPWVDAFSNYLSLQLQLQVFWGMSPPALNI